MFPQTNQIWMFSQHPIGFGASFGAASKWPEAPLRACQNETENNESVPHTSAASNPPKFHLQLPPARCLHICSCLLHTALSAAITTSCQLILCHCKIPPVMLLLPPAAAKISQSPLKISSITLLPAPRSAASNPPELHSLPAHLLPLLSLVIPGCTTRSPLQNYVLLLPLSPRSCTYHFVAKSLLSPLRSSPVKILTAPAASLGSPAAPPAAITTAPAAVSCAVAATTAQLHQNPLKISLLPLNSSPMPVISWLHLQPH